MKWPPRIVFLGNHTVGVRTLGVLAANARLVGVVAHPEDSEDGVRYESVFEAAQKFPVPALRAAGKSSEVEHFIIEAKPDLLWIADYRYILPPSVLKLAPFGTVNLHPSLLPKYRGRAPVNWAILNGETRLGLTAHWVDIGMDTGDIIAQRPFYLNQCQDVADALAMLYPIYQSLTEDVLQAMRVGEVPRQPQDESQATAFPRRTPGDGVIDWRKPCREVWNLVRAVAPPYPGAFVSFLGGILRVQRVTGISPFKLGVCYEPGSLVNGTLSESQIDVACADGVIHITKYTYEC